jgi:hypothetical protein
MASNRQFAKLALRVGDATLSRQPSLQFSPTQRKFRQREGFRKTGSMTGWEAARGLRSSSEFAGGAEGESRQAGDDFQHRSKMLVDDGPRADFVMRDQRIEQLPVLGKDDAEALRI